MVLEGRWDFKEQFNDRLVLLALICFLWFPYLFASSFSGGRCTLKESINLFKQVHTQKAKTCSMTSLFRCFWVAWRRFPLVFAEGRGLEEATWRLAWESVGVLRRDSKSF